MPSPGQSDLLRPILLAAISWLGAMIPAWGQMPVTITNTMDPLERLMTAQPPTDLKSPVIAHVVFDPPVVRPGETAYYRITLNALSDSISQLPEQMVAADGLELQPGARGQILLPAGAVYRPLTAINFRARADKPGSYLVAPFLVDVYGRPVNVPGARLLVTTNALGEDFGPARLSVEVDDTNVFMGQAVSFQATKHPTALSSIPSLMDMRCTGDGFFMDPGPYRQLIQTRREGNRIVSSFTIQSSITPIKPGRLEFIVQGFSPGSRASGPVILSGPNQIVLGNQDYLLLESDPVTLNVRPLPQSGKLPGFTGGVGSFDCDPPLLSTNTVRVGEPVDLIVRVRGQANLERLIPPPPPRVRTWQIFAGKSLMTNAPFPQQQPGRPVQHGQAKEFHFTLIPLADDLKATPAIPFSCFDPSLKDYFDLTIPRIPITVLPGTGDAAALAALRDSGGYADANEGPKLSDLSKTVGRSSANLIPLQARGGFVGVQLLPVALCTGLWMWDRRRRYLARHPELVRRRKARRDLRRHRRALRKAARAHEVSQYAAGAIRALQVAAAPHYPAEPRALVCGDILPLLDGVKDGEKLTNVVRRVYETTNASQYGFSPEDAAGLFSLKDEIDLVLERLEARL